MSIGNIFVATTIAPVVVILASMSLQLLTLGLEQLKKFSSHSYSKNPLSPYVRKLNFLINNKCFGETDIDVNNFNNILLMAIIMCLIGIALSVWSTGEKTAASVAKIPVRGKGNKGGGNSNAHANGNAKANKGGST